MKTKEKSIRPILVRTLLFSYPILLYSCSGDNIKNSIAYGKLFGKIKSVKSTHYSVNEKDGELLKKTLVGTELFKFNEQGKCTEGIQNTIDSGSGLSTTYTFDENGRLVSNISKKENSTEVIYTTIYNYDDKNSLIGKIISGMYNSKYAYYHDANGNLSQAKIYKANGDLTGVIQYHFDDKGQISGEEISDVNNSANNRTYTDKYEGFDKSGNWTKHIMYENAKPLQIVSREIEYY